MAAASWRAGVGGDGRGSDAEAEATLGAFDQWLDAMKARSDSSLTQTLTEMGLVKDGIASTGNDLMENKRQGASVQQLMQAQLTELRENLASAHGEITSLVQEKTSTDHELVGEIQSLQEQFVTKTQELELLKKSYSQTHLSLQNSLIQIQSLLQATSSDIASAKGQVQAFQEAASAKFDEVASSTERLRGLLESTGREGESHRVLLRENITKVHEALTSLSAEFSEHRRLTMQAQQNLQNQVHDLEEDRRRVFLKGR